MVKQEAVTKLKAAGLITRDLDQLGIFGWVWKDSSSGLGMVQDCYSLKPNSDGSYETFLEKLNLTQNLPLDEAVELVIQTVIVAPNIERPGLQGY
jgi:hypothetical protein